MVTIAMGHANRLIGYLAGVGSASLVYVIWFVGEFELKPMHEGVGVWFSIGFAIFFWLFEGMGAALILMVLPWYLAVRAYGRLQRFGMIYFSLIGAASALVIGCGASSLAPKPLFIEDQTFLEGFVIAAERQGVCLLLTGLVLGLTYWLVSERLRQSRPLKTC